MKKQVPKKHLAPNFKKLIKIANKATEEKIALGHPTHYENEYRHRRRIQTLRFFAKEGLVDLSPEVIADHKLISELYLKAEKEDRFIEPEEFQKKGLNAKRMARVNNAINKQVQPVIREYHTAYLSQVGTKDYEKNNNCIRALRKSHDTMGGYLSMWLDELRDLEKKQKSKK